MKMTQFANFANDATKQILGVTGLQRENLQSMFSYPDAINISDPKTVDGDIIYIDDGTPLEAKRVTVNIESYLDGSGIPSPSNVRNVVGWNSINIYRYGKNMLNPALFKDQQAWNVIKFYAPEGTVLTLSTTLPDRPDMLLYFYNVGEPQGTSNRVYNGKSVTRIVSAAGYINVTQRRVSGTDSFSNYNFQLEMGLSVTEYEPYKGVIYNIDFPIDVYGGFVNITNGSMSIDRIKLKLGDFTNWNWHASTNSYTASRLSNSPFPQLKQGNILCEIAPYVDRNSIASVTIGISISVSGTSIFLKDNVHSGTEDLEDFITAIKDVEAVFYIYTPQYRQIESTEITLLEGINVVYADCGSIEMEYYRRGNGGDF